MLLDIAKLPTAENSAIHLHPADNVAVARVPLAAGMQIIVDGASITVLDAVPAGHKVALKRIGEGEIVYRYGQSIGRAKRTIEPGNHIHTANLGYEEAELAYEFPEDDIPYPAAPAKVPTFMGYVREDGRVGTRNYIAVVAASNCAAHTVEMIAGSFDSAVLPESIDGVVAFPHGDGCAQTLGPDTDQLRRTLAGMMAHPNVAAAVILGLGCEVNQIDHYLGPDGPRTPRIA
jgi:altronate hydrolase